MSSLDDDAQSTKGGDEQDEYENDGNSASEYRVHDRQVIKRPNNFRKESGSSGAMDLEPALQARKTG